MTGYSANFQGKHLGTYKTLKEACEAYINRYECKGRLHVDKDILHPGNKVYSPENCILLPQRINELFFVSSRGTSNLPQGTNYKRCRKRI